MENKYMKMLREDKLYDKKSIIFYENKMEEVVDERDRSNIPEGRLGEFPMERIETAMGLTVILPMTKESCVLGKAKERIDLENQFLIVAETRMFSVQKIPFSEFEMHLENYQKHEDFILSRAEVRLQEFKGVFDCKEFGKMLGLISFISGREYVYLVKYAGKGNFTDIRMEQENIINYIYKRVKA